jgi:hypothetical protein
MMVAEETAADTPDHRAVALDKRRESRFVLLLDEGCQQLPICPDCHTLLQHSPANMPDHSVDRSRRHGRPPWLVVSHLYSLLPGRSQVYALSSSGERSTSRRANEECRKCKHPDGPLRHSGAIGCNDQLPDQDSNLEQTG